MRPDGARGSARLGSTEVRARSRRARSRGEAWRRLALILLASVPLQLAATTGGDALDDILGNIVLDRRSTKNGVPPVVFPHWKHRSRFRCYVCHSTLFQMEAGAGDITMDALRSGKLCGRCHDGRTAFAIGFDTCRTCHSLAEP